MSKADPVCLHLSSKICILGSRRISVSCDMLAGVTTDDKTANTEHTGGGPRWTWFDNRSVLVASIRFGNRIGS
jgi:hypothetical protein